MGYSYEILLEYKEGDEWKILEEYNNSGSYHSSNNHYFLNNFNWSDKIENYDRNKDYKEDGYYYIDIKKMKNEYMEICNKINDWKSKVIEYINNINCIKLLNEYVEEISYDYEQVPEYFEELEKWIKILKEYEEKGYIKMRILYGYSG
jgi:hypothetical protein